MKDIHGLLFGFNSHSDAERKVIEDRERKEREEADKREKARLEAERKEREELERQLQIQRELEQEREEKRKRELEQKEVTFLIFRQYTHEVIVYNRIFFCRRHAKKWKNNDKLNGKISNYKRCNRCVNKNKKSY